MIEKDPEKKKILNFEKGYFISDVHRESTAESSLAQRTSLQGQESLQKKYLSLAGARNKRKI